MTPPELERSPAARVLAERALVNLVTALGDEKIDLIVLGGLVPEVLVAGQEPSAPPHLGTTDVDLLLTARLATDQNLAGLESALWKIGFSPFEHPWRWRGMVSGQAVKIEFLCDLPERVDQIDVELEGCDTLMVWNLRGTGFVAADWQWQTLTTTDPESGQESRSRVRFAGLCGYLLSKIVASRSRGAEKDFYDLVYVLRHNRAGGPSEAARQILANDLASELKGLQPTMVELAERFRAPISLGPSSYAAEQIRLDPSGDDRSLRAEAVAAVREFLFVLRSDP